MKCIVFLCLILFSFTCFSQVKVKQQSKRVKIISATATTVGFLVADDATIIGTVDDLLIPLVVIGGVTYAVLCEEESDGLFTEVLKYDQLTDEIVESLISKYTIVDGEKCMITGCYYRRLPHSALCKKHFERYGKINGN